MHSKITGTCVGTYIYPFCRELFIISGSSQASSVDGPVLEGAVMIQGAEELAHLHSHPRVSLRNRQCPLTAPSVDTSSCLEILWAGFYKHILLSGRGDHDEVSLPLIGAAVRGLFGGGSRTLSVSPSVEVDDKAMTLLKRGIQLGRMLGQLSALAWSLYHVLH